MTVTCEGDECDAGVDGPRSQDAGDREDAGVVRDAGIGLDAGAEDAGVDAGADDAGVDDAGVDDAGVDDAGVPSPFPEFARRRTLRVATSGMEIDSDFVVAAPLAGLDLNTTIQFLVTDDDNNVLDAEFDGQTLWFHVSSVVDGEQFILHLYDQPVANPPISFGSPFEHVPALTSLVHVQNRWLDRRLPGRVIVEPDSAQYAAGAFSRAARFIDNTEIADSARFAFNQPSGAGAVSVWFEWDPGAVGPFNQALWHFSADDEGDLFSADYQQSLLINDSSEIVTRRNREVNDQSGVGSVAVNHGTFEPGWHHALVTWTRGDVIEFYLDGVLVSAVLPDDDFPNISSLRVGGPADTASGIYRSFRGLIDEVRVFDARVSAEYARAEAALLATTVIVIAP